MIVAMDVSAHDIEMKNADGISIYYNWINNKTELEVTLGDTYLYSGAIIIPASIAIEGATYSVTSIGKSAFSGCTSLSEITIPNSVITIGDFAFSRCTSLSKITIPNSVIAIGDYAFNGCTKINKITIPNSVTTIGESAFKNCSGITTITLPNSVTSIGNNAFSGCNGLTELLYNEHFFVYMPSSYKGAYEISDGIKEICSSAFSGCKDMTSVTFPNSITSIGEYAFSGCSNLTSIQLSDNLTHIGRWAFTGTGIKSFYLPDNITDLANYPVSDTFGDAKLYVNKGTKTLLSLWSGYGKPYDGETNEELPAPYLQSTSSTQTTLHMRINNFYDEYEYEIDNSEITNVSDIFYDNLFPGDQSFYLKVKLNDHSYVSRNTIQTQSLNEKIDYTKTASSIRLRASYTKGDANITAIRLNAFNSNFNTKVTDSVLTIVGLDPQTWVRMYMEIDITNALNIKRTYTVGSRWLDGTGINTTLDNLTFNTLQPKVASPGNVVVAAESNIDDEETNVGFEWRRTDWTDDFTSNSGGAYLYEGTMEGYIRNLNTEKLWKYRPYYESNNGNRYYGDWVGIDPTNTSYFEPTVHTYAQVSVDGNKAMVKGYVMRGSDNVTAQGFMYWKTSNGARAEAGSNVTVPKDAMTVEAKGNMMTATLEGLDYESTYSYVAFMTTSEGETFYGELQSFQTGEDTSGVETLVTKANDSKTAIYDIRGRRLDAPQRGINIIRMSNGKTQKVFVK